MLLLAIGLGVLIGRIGHNDSNAPPRAPAPQVITVQGGGGVAATTPTTRTTVHVNKKQKAKLNSAAKATAPPPAAVQKKAAQAASKVLGNSKNLPPPTSTVWTEVHRHPGRVLGRQVHRQLLRAVRGARSCGCPD